MALSVAEVNNDLNIFGNSSYRTKKRRSHCGKQHPQRGNGFCGSAVVGGDAVYATTANKGHTEIVFMWKMENFCFSTEENYGILSPLFYRRYNSDTVNSGEAGSEEN